MFGVDAAIINQYRSSFGWRDKHGKAHGNFLLYVEAYNLCHPNERIVRCARFDFLGQNVRRYPTCVMTVFTGESSSPRSRKKPSTRGLISSSSSFDLPVITKSSA
jgi:hypothetical protein